MLPDGLTVEEFHVDAGAGFEWPGWVEHRDETLSRASAAMRPRVLGAFDDPPSGRYVPRPGRVVAGRGRSVSTHLHFGIVTTDPDRGPATLPPVQRVLMWICSAA